MLIFLVGACLVDSSIDLDSTGAGNVEDIDADIDTDTDTDIDIEPLDDSGDSGDSGLGCASWGSLSADFSSASGEISAEGGAFVAGATLTGEGRVCSTSCSAEWAEVQVRDGTGGWAAPPIDVELPAPNDLFPWLIAMVGAVPEGAPESRVDCTVTTSTGEWSAFLAVAR